MRTAQQRKEILVEPLSLLLGLVLFAAIFVTQLSAGAASVAASGGTDYYVNGSTGSNTLYDGTSPTVNGIHGPWATISYAAATAPAGATI